MNPLPEWFRFDPVLRSARNRLLRLWRPMAGWSLLVWIVVAVVLAPVSSVLLGWSWFRGGEALVANEALLGWALTPPGFVWLVLSGSLTLTGSVLHFAGVFQIVTDDLESADASLPATALHLAPQVPSLLRLCMASVAAGLIIALPLGAVLFGIHRLFLGGQDINYYLAERPSAWWYAVTAAGIWTLSWGATAAYLGGRCVLAFPAYLDGHRGLVTAIQRSWRNTRGEGVRIVRVLGISVAVWLVVRTLVDAAAVAAGGAVLGWIASGSDSLRLLTAGAGGWAAVSLVLDATVWFLGIAYVSTLLSKLYHEDTGLHAVARGPRVGDLPGTLRSFLGWWLRPRRIIPLLALALAVSAATGAALLERIPEPGPVVVVAHRGGPPPAPENTLAALERAIEAGAEWSEIDVQLTRDTVPVLVHDADLRRVAGDPRRVAELTYEELRGTVQGRDRSVPPEERLVATLEQFLGRARGRIGLAIELKHYGRNSLLNREVARLLREREEEDLVMVMSMELRAVQEFSELAPGIPVGYGAAALVGDPTRLPVDFLALSRKAVTREVLRAAHRTGIDVYVWTVNRAATMAELIQERVDGIITDRPRLAVRVREELADLPAASRLLLRFGHLLILDAEDTGSDSQL